MTGGSIADLLFGEGGATRCSALAARTRCTVATATTRWSVARAPIRCSAVPAMTLRAANAGSASILYGQDGADVMYAGFATLDADVLYGGEGNDTLFALAGSVDAAFSSGLAMYGGSSADRFSFSNMGSVARWLVPRTPRRCSTSRTAPTRSCCLASASRLVTARPCRCRRRRRERPDAGCSDWYLPVLDGERAANDVTLYINGTVANTYAVIRVTGVTTLDINDWGSPDRRLGAGGHVSPAARRQWRPGAPFAFLGFVTGGSLGSGLLGMAWRVGGGNAQSALPPRRPAAIAPP